MAHAEGFLTYVWFAIRRVCHAILPGMRSSNRPLRIWPHILHRWDKGHLSKESVWNKNDRWFIGSFISRYLHKISISLLRSLIILQWNENKSFSCELNNADQSQECASRLLTTGDSAGSHRTTSLVEIARNLFIIIINQKNSITTS